MLLPGTVYFAGTSSVWGGGVALYDHQLPGPVRARAWLLTHSQFSDVVAQEMHTEPGTDLDLSAVLAAGREEIGPGRYQTLLHVGSLDTPSDADVHVPRTDDGPAAVAAGPAMLRAGLRGSR